jgi:hypothetical protein
VQVTLTDQSVVAIGPNTRLEMSAYAIDTDSRTGRITIAAGRFWMHVKKWTKPGASLYEVSTPNAVAGVRGTTLWGDTDVDAICALEGSIEVRSLRQSGLAAAVLSAGNCASQLSQGKLEPLAPTKEQLDKYLKEVLIPSAPRETR